MFKVKLLASAQKICLIYPKQLEHEIMKIVFNSIGVEMPGSGVLGYTDEI